MRRNITLPGNLRDEIAFAADFLGVSGQRFIELALRNELADMNATIPAYRRARKQVRK